MNPIIKSPTIKAARINLVNTPFALGMPWAILVVAFVANLAIFGSIGDVPVDDRVTGAISSIYAFGVVVNVQAMTQVFPFAAGLGLTRRHFLAGATLFVAGQALLTGALLTLLLELERATDGWGMQLRFFGLPGFIQPNPLAQVLAYAAPYALACTIGLGLGTVFKRWGQMGMFVLALIAVTVVGALVVLLTWREAWGAVGRFFTDTSDQLLTIGYPVLLAGVVWAGTYALIRRATP